MTRKDKRKSFGHVSKSGSLGKFLPGEELGPLNNRDEYEGRLKTLPAEQQEFAEESACFADLWQYFSEHKMQLPENVSVEVAELPKLQPQEQIRGLRAVNQKLMDYLHDVSKDSGTRH